MAIGRPFQRGQPRPPGSGRKKGTQTKPRSLRERIERRRARRDAALDALYESDPKRALELEAQFHRDDVVSMRFEQGDPQESGTPQQQIEAMARAAGPITDEQALDAYLTMTKGDASDEARIIMARFALGEARAVAARLALGLAAAVHDCRTLREAITSGRISGSVTVGQLLTELALESQAAQEASPARSERDDLAGMRYRGTPVDGAPGQSVIEARDVRPRREPYRDPPMIPPPIDAESPEPPAEPRKRPAHGFTADPRSQLGPVDFDSADRVSIFENEQVPVFGFGSSQRRR